MSPRHYTRFPAVEGYANQQSYGPGETVTVHCSSRAANFTAEVTRVGLARTVVWRRDDIAGAEQPYPDDAYATGCGWSATFTVDVDPAWPSGFYEISLRADGVSGPEAESEAFFVVRPASPSASALLVLSTNTYNAYNQWGGACLYSGATEVSFARPMERGYLRRPAAPDEVDFDGRIAQIADEPDVEHLALQEYQAANEYPLWCASSGWHNWERRFVQWAERNGIALDYAVNSDLERHPEVLDGHNLVLSVGHDEYWTWGMRDRIDEFVDGSGNWAILSGNTCFWQVRYGDDGDSMICHKGRGRLDDPVVGTVDQHLTTTMWSSPLIGRPEPSTTGLTFSRGGYARIGQATPRGSGGYTVHRPDHWAFASTELRYGDLLGSAARVVGYEVDGCDLDLVDGLPVATGADGAPDGLTVLATAAARLISITPEHCEAPAALWASVDPPGDLEFVAMELFGDASAENVAKVANGHAVMASFERGQGTVFNAGSADWCYGLDRDPLVQQVTYNVMSHLGGLG